MPPQLRELPSKAKQARVIFTLLRILLMRGRGEEATQMRVCQRVAAMVMVALVACSGPTQFVTTLPLAEGQTLEQQLAKGAANVGCQFRKDGVMLVVNCGVGTGNFRHVNILPSFDLDRPGSWQLTCTRELDENECKAFVESLLSKAE